MKNFLAICAVMGLWSSIGIAEDKVPEDLLAVDYQRCMQGCEPDFGAKVCTMLCSCTVREFKGKLNMQAYLDLNMQLSRNEIDEKTRIFLDSVANTCAAEVEASGIDVPDAGAK